MKLVLVVLALSFAGGPLAAQDAYAAPIGRIRVEDYLLAAAFVLIDEVRHATVWQRVLGIRIY